MIKFMNKRNERIPRIPRIARRFESRRVDDWYVIMDGSDDPYICHENEIAECIGELKEVIVDSVCEDLQDSISDRRSLNPMVSAVIDRCGDPAPYESNPDYWITVYCVDTYIIRKYNEYAEEHDLPIIDEDDPTEEQIRKALWNKHGLDLAYFLEKKHYKYESYYTPDLALESDVVEDLAVRLIEIFEEDYDT